MEVYIPGQGIVLTQSDTELQHYGVIGMKWGVRRSRRNRTASMNGAQKRMAKRTANDAYRAARHELKQQRKAKKAKTSWTKWGEAKAKSDYKIAKKAYEEGNISKAELNKAKKAYNVAKGTHGHAKAVDRYAKSLLGPEQSKQTYTEMYDMAIDRYSGKKGKARAEFLDSANRAVDLGKAATAATAVAGGFVGGVGVGVAAGTAVGTVAGVAAQAHAKRVAKRKGVYNDYFD